MGKASQKQENLADNKTKSVSFCDGAINFLYFVVSKIGEMD